MKMNLLLILVFSILIGSITCACPSIVNNPVATPKILTTTDEDWSNFIADHGINYNNNKTEEIIRLVNN
jgi:hypothetical protein